MGPVSVQTLTLHATSIAARDPQETRGDRARAAPRVCGLVPTQSTKLALQSYATIGYTNHHEQIIIYEYVLKAAELSLVSYPRFRVTAST